MPRNNGRKSGCLWFEVELIYIVQNINGNTF